ncbi:carbohydrate porin [Leptolyngbya sp. Heron Island J]|uniref:carbohydrate porin n=1 Tax=Leptolyngbya sp. Heron Island J TaxID=1385935 RepID=UPI0013766638|nr:carbohydrate porin [Leptolyngbya sp. Heron Island J]
MFHLLFVSSRWSLILVATLLAWTSVVTQRVQASPLVESSIEDEIDLQRVELQPSASEISVPGPSDLLLQEEETSLQAEDSQPEPSALTADLLTESPIEKISFQAEDLQLEPSPSMSTADLPAESSEPEESGLAAGAPRPSVRSRALNLGALRALKKPLTERVLDTGLSAPLRQRPDNPTFWTRDFLTGDWNGWRDRLYEQGIDLYALQIVDTYVQPTGGLSQSSTVNSLTLVGTDLHTDRLGWWPNGQIHVTAALIETESLARDSIGALNSTYFNDAPTNGARLFEVWYGQKFDNNKGEVRVGTQYPFVRIASNQPSSMFSNTAFDYPHFLGTTPALGMSVPYAAAPFGIQLSYSFTPEIFFIGQLSDGFQDPSGGIENYRNLSIGLSAQEGMEGILELSYKPNQRPGSTGLPGNYKAGIQFHTGRFNVNNTANSNTTQWGNGAIYAMGDQMLYAEPGSRTQGLTGFLKTVFTPYEDINMVEFHAAGGLTYEGLIPNRDRDVLGLAVAYTKISEGLRDADRIAGTSVRDAETVAELIYSADIAPWWNVIGSVQYIINPGGYRDRDDALVFGISNRFSF